MVLQYLFYWHGQSLATCKQAEHFVIVFFFLNIYIAMKKKGEKGKPYM